MNEAIWVTLPVTIQQFNTCVNNAPSISGRSHSVVVCPCRFRVSLNFGRWVVIMNQKVWAIIVDMDSHGRITVLIRKKVETHDGTEEHTSNFGRWVANMNNESVGND
jgi:hypothetical protein